MWAFTKTPLGRLALALRDNEHRVRFLGFDTRLARTVIFAISCMFAGVAGSLLAIANELANYTVFSGQNSANVVLHTFIGGAGTFFGPALGAAVMTYFGRIMSDLTRSWLLYQGLVFVLVMLFLPEGLGGLVSLHARKLRSTWLAPADRTLSALPPGSGHCCSLARYSPSRAFMSSCPMTIEHHAQQPAAPGFRTSSLEGCSSRWAS